MKKLERLIWWIACGVLVASVMTGCKKKADDEDDDTSAENGVNGNGSGSGSLKLDAAAGQVSSNITTVQENMVPGSLVVSGANLNLLEDNPCADTDGFFDCQPNLLKLYIGLGQTVVGSINEFVKAVSAGLFTSITIPLDGVEVCNSIEGDSGEGEVIKVDYCVTSTEKYAVLLHTADGPFIYLSVDSNKYEIRGDMTKVSDAGGGPGQMRAVVSYTDADTFDVEVETAGAACQDDDIRAPEKIVIRIAKQNGTWQGKSMLYHPRWLFNDDDGVTCATESSDSLGLAFYTDFVGNDDKSTASIYFMPRSVDDMSSIGSYDVDDFCTNYPDFCDGDGRSFDDPNPIATTYQNSSCVEGETTTWNSACDSDNELISTPTYSDASEWLTPAELTDLAITMPSTIGAD